MVVAKEALVPVETSELTLAHDCASELSVDTPLASLGFFDAFLREPKICVVVIGIAFGLSSEPH